MTRRQHFRNLLIIALILAVGLYWYLSTPDKARLELSQMQGKIPKLDTMRPEKFPTVKIAKIVGWAKGAKPTPAKGLGVTEFAADLDHPRWLHVLPNGDVLVAESTQPSRPVDGVMDWIARKLIMDANGSKVSANRITLLRDADGDGVAEFRSSLLEGLNSPFGMALYGESLLVANTDEVRAFPFKVGDTKITAKGQKMMSLPAGSPNNHWARNIIIDPKGEKLFVTIGSNSNIAENGMDAEKDRAQIKQYDLKTGQTRIWAYGIRNPNGLAFNPISGSLWMTVNERDMLGSDGPPDYLSTADFGTFYGWPYYYWGGMEDRRVPQSRRDLRQYSKRPDYALGPHVAALGLAFSPGGKAWGDSYANGAFVAMHGSWNRVPVSGYKVVYIPYNERGFPQDEVKPVDVLTEFLNPKGEAQGRPAGLAFDKGGGLLVADDSGNRIWRVTPAKGTAP